MKLQLHLMCLNWRIDPLTVFQSVGWWVKLFFGVDFLKSIYFHLKDAACNSGIWDTDTSFTSGIIKIWVQESSASVKSTFLNSHGHPSKRLKWKSGKDCQRCRSIVTHTWQLQCKLVEILWKIVWQYLLNVYLPYGLAIPLVWYIPILNEWICAPKDTYMRMFIIALFITSPD